MNKKFKYKNLFIKKIELSRVNLDVIEVGMDDRIGLLN